MNIRFFKKNPVITICVFGLLVRIIGIFHGYPDAWHPDEWRIVLETLSMAQQKSLIPANINYPLLFRYIILFCYGTLYILLRIVGYIHTQTDFAGLFFRHPGIFLIIPRAINSLIGTATIYVGYLCATKLFNKKIAVTAAIFLAVESVLLTHSQVGLHQPISFLTPLIVLYVSILLLRNPSTFNFLLLGSSLGLAASSHQTAVLLIPSVAYVTIISLIPSKKKMIAITEFLVGGIFFSIIGNLNYVFKLKESIDFLRLGSELSKVGFSSHQVFSNTLPGFYAWIAQEFVIQDYLIGFLVIFGILYALFRRRREDWFYIIMLITYGLFFTSWAYWWMHLIVGIIPIAVIYAAGSFWAIGIHFRRKTAKLLLILVLIPSVISVVWIDTQRLKTDTRIEAKSWVEANIKNGSNIAIDWSAYNLNLNSNIPIFLRNPVGEHYFEKNIPSVIKKQLSSRYPLYNIIDAQYSTTKPNWPSDMPNDLVQKGQASYVYENLYSYFNFDSLQSLSKKAQYLVISSYSYTMFLLDNDPNKVNMFNIYLKDDMEKYYSHISNQPEGNDFDLIYYVAKRGRNFYEPLLNGSQPYFKEIKRFEPNHNYYGPTIIIYQSTDYQPNE